MRRRPLAATSRGHRLHPSRGCGNDCQQKTMTSGRRSSSSSSSSSVSETSESVVCRRCPLICDKRIRAAIVAAPPACKHAVAYLRGTKVCRYNWHSAGSLGWPFPMTEYKFFFSNKMHGSNFIKRHSETVMFCN